MTSLLDTDHASEKNPLSKIERLEDRLEALERMARTGTTVQIEAFETNVSNPPTDAELDSALGEPADVGVGYTAIINDNGAGANCYLVWSDGANWWYEAGSKAS
jgi:hypothetical protein